MVVGCVVLLAGGAYGGRAEVLRGGHDPWVGLAGVTEALQEGGGSTTVSGLRHKHKGHVAPGIQVQVTGAKPVAFHGTVQVHAGRTQGVSYYTWHHAAAYQVPSAAARGLSVFNTHGRYTARSGEVPIPAGPLVVPVNPSGPTCTTPCVS